MQKTNNLQEVLLAQIRRQKLNVTMFMVNGFQMRGIITGYDAFTVILQTENKQQIVYKHAISTIVPERTVELREGEAAPRYIPHP